MAFHIPSRARRIITAIVALIVFVVLAGATYQGVATALERHRYQRPGGLVDVGGHQLHIYCIGTGAPTVVLEAGAGAMSSAWGWVQPEIAKTTRVCSYDRSGLGWSEAGDGNYVPSRVPEELHALLAQANERGPFVLVGHELGATFARMFAARHRGDVAALILIDEPSPATDTATSRMVSAWPWLARAGVLRATGSLSAQALALPGDSGGAMRAFLNRPDHLTRAATELARAQEAEAMAQQAGDAHGLHVMTLSVGAMSKPEMIVTREDALRVTRAIETALMELRGQAATSSHESSAAP